MILKPGVGIGQLVFGMQQPAVIALLGEPDGRAIDEDDENEVILQYNNIRVWLSFYQLHNDKLGYIRCENPELEYNGQKLIGANADDVTDDILTGNWEIDSYPDFDSYFDEAKWMVVNAEHDTVTDVELGVPFNEDNDTYNWPQQ